MRVRAIGCCVKYGLLPSRLYESERHYDCGYWRHLWINVVYGLRWLTFRETEDDRAFGLRVNARRRRRWLRRLLDGRALRAV